MKRNSSKQDIHTSRRGSALVMVTVLIVGLATLSAAMLTTGSSSAREQRKARENVSALYVAEAGLNEAFAMINNGADGNLGTEGQPVGFGSSSYWVERADMGGNLTSLTAVGIDGLSRAELELVVSFSSGSLFSWAAFGDEEMIIKSNASVDSYDSSLGSYDEQDVNGSGADTYANANGDVGSNADILLKQNATVYGDLAPGPSGVVDILGNAVCTGATSPMPSEVEMPPLEIPVIPSSGELTVSGAGSLASGDYNFTNVTVETGSTLTVIGPATIVMGSFLMDSNTRFEVDGANGPVELFILDDFDLNSNAIMASLSQDPAELRVNLQSDNIIDPDIDVNFDPDAVDFDSNSKLYGTIYAPNAEVIIDSNFELFGSVVARRLTLSSQSFIHFDENLFNLDDGGARSFQRLCWRVVSFGVEQTHSY